MTRARRIRLTLEILILFYGLPLAYVYGPRTKFVFMLLWPAAAVAFRVLWRDPTFDRRRLWGTAGMAGPSRSILPLFALGCLVLTGFVMWLAPNALFDLPRHHTAFWLLVITLYPLLSVLPQEIIWRALFFHRYGPLFGSTTMTLWASALAFSWVHVVMLNAWAVWLTLIGGLLFGHRFVRTGSLVPGAFEHALYGILIFTVGLGMFFVIG